MRADTCSVGLAVGGKAAKPADPNVTYSSTLESDDVNKYDVTQVYTFVLDKRRQSEAYYETSFDVMGSEEHWELDDRLIDFDMLSAQPEDADRIFEELKKRALAQKKKEKAPESAQQKKADDKADLAIKEAKRADAETVKANARTDEALFEARTLLLSGPVDDKMLKEATVRCLAMEQKDGKKPITVFINSPGGSADSGFAIYDDAYYRAMYRPHWFLRNARKYREREEHNGRFGSGRVRDELLALVEPARADPNCAIFRHTWKKRVACEAAALAAGALAGAPWCAAGTAAARRGLAMLALNAVADNPGARKQSKRLGRGPGSSHGKTCGRGARLVSSSIH